MGIRSASLGYGDDSTRQKFVSKERDIETGLDYFLARYYSDIQGRFISVDPENAGSFLNDPQSWNGYAYVVNNPCANTDPSGRETCYYSNGSKIGCEGDKRIQVDAKAGTLTFTPPKGSAPIVYDLNKVDAQFISRAGAPTPQDFMFEMDRRATGTKQLIGAFAVGGPLIGAGVGGAMAAGGVAAGGGITTLGLSGGASAATDAAFIGVTAEEIAAINSELGGATTLTGHVDTVIANMTYREAFWDKAATVVRDIAGRHLFNDANKRTAQKVVEELMGRNGVTGPSSMHIRAVVDKVATGALRTVEEISRALGNPL